jgi:hypothetical protein
VLKLVVRSREGGRLPCCDAGRGLLATVTAEATDCCDGGRRTVEGFRVVIVDLARVWDGALAFDAAEGRPAEVVGLDKLALGGYRLVVPLLDSAPSFPLAETTLPSALPAGRELFKPDALELVAVETLRDEDVGGFTGSRLGDAFLTGAPPSRSPSNSVLAPPAAAAGLRRERERPSVIEDDDMA